MTYRRAPFAVADEDLERTRSQLTVVGGKVAPNDTLVAFT
jgi:hypothetical protein